MLRGYIIEIQRGHVWNRLTTVGVVYASPADRAAANQRALKEAKRQLQGWRDHFRTARLRIREAV